MIEVAVAGGGPAGSACAALLARDHDVVVFEEHPSIGHPVQCAGLVTDRVIELSGVSPDVLSTLYGAEVVFPDGRIVTVRSDSPKARAIDRADLDSRMADRAMDAGAEFRMSARVGSVAVTDRVTLGVRGSEVAAGLLVGADGHRSVAASAIGASPSEHLRGMQADVRARMEHDDMFRIRLGSRYAPGFFTWEIPCGDTTRVGLCTSWSAGPPNGYLRRLLSDLGIEDRVESMHCGRIPLGPPSRISSDRVMLVGDAAAQVKPVSAGGLRPSLEAASILADVASSALGAGDLSAGRLSEYDRRWEDGMGGEISGSMRIRRAFAGMDDDDLSLAGAYAARPDVTRALDGIDIDHPTRVIRTLLRHPRAAAAGVWTLMRCLL